MHFYTLLSWSSLSQSKMTPHTLNSTKQWHKIPFDKQGYIFFILFLGKISFFNLYSLSALLCSPRQKTYSPVCQPVLPNKLANFKSPGLYFTNNGMLFLGNLWLIKSSIFQNNQMIRMINLKANENKAHKSLK